MLTHIHVSLFFMMLAQWGVASQGEYVKYGDPYLPAAGSLQTTTPQVESIVQVAHNQQRDEQIPKNTVTQDTKRIAQIFLKRSWKVPKSQEEIERKWHEKLGNRQPKPKPKNSNVRTLSSDDLLSHWVGGAIERGDITMIRNIANGGISLSGVRIGVDKKTPMMCVIDIGRINMVIAMLELGKEACTVSQPGHSVMSYAAKVGRTDVLELLINEDDHHPNDLMHDDYPEMSSLISAAASGHTGTVKYLLSRGASLTRPLVALNGSQERVIPQGEAALTVAVAEQPNNCIGVVKLLLDANVNPDAKGLAFGDEKFVTPLMLASRVANKELSDLLIVKKSNVEAQSSHGKTALMHAAQEGSLTAVSNLVENHGARVNPVVSDAMYSPLTLAAQCGYIDIARYLLKNKADIHRPLCDSFNSPGTKVTQGVEALHRAIIFGHPKLVELFLTEGVSRTAPGKHGYSAYDLVKRQTAGQGVCADAHDNEIYQLIVPKKIEEKPVKACS